jgi:TPR repeat/Tetratricopeptide repeat
VTRPTPWIVALAGTALAFAALGAAPPNLTKAVEAQRKLAAERASDPAVFNDLGNLLALGGDAAGAETAYRKAVELSPDKPAPRYNLALLLQQRGDRQEAMKEYKEVVRLDPGHAWAHYQIGSLYEVAGDDAKAIRAYAKAFSLEPRLAFPEYNPGIIENHLVAKAMLRGYQNFGGEPQAPKVYEDPARIAGLLLPTPPAGAAAPAAEAGTEDAAAPPAVLTGDDLDQRPVNQATAQDSSSSGGYRPSAGGRPAQQPTVRTWNRLQAPTGGVAPGTTTFVPVVPGTAVPSKPGSNQNPDASGRPRVVRPPGRVRYVPGSPSTGRLDLQVIPGRSDGSTERAG